SLSNREIADIFERCADMLQIRGDNIHRVLSYRRASETIRAVPRDLRVIASEGGLTDLSYIGKTIAAKIDEMLESGELDFYNRLKADVPEGLVDIMHINGVGPKKAKLFWEKLDITSVDALKIAADNDKLAALPGMGKKSQQKILDGIEALSRQTGRANIGDALPAAQGILDLLLELPQAQEGALAGSIRRGRETIGDVDILIAADDSGPIMERFVNMENVARVLGHGPTKSSVELLSGLQVDVRVLEKARWGTALNYFSGSLAHNVRMRQIALDQGLSLNEHALSPVDENKTIIESADKILCDSEEKVYETLGLQYVPPELREDSGEIEAAREHRLPRLIERGDIVADLHMHTDWSDGANSIREMVEACVARGHQYIVITDHSRSLGIANGLSIERLLAQAEAVRELNDEMGDVIQVFAGTEMDIKADGSLDYPDDALAQLDFVIASLHSGLSQKREQVTARLLNAISNPYVRMIGHPSARQYPNREEVDADWDAVLAAAKAHDTILEINANPLRLDLKPELARLAKDLGVKLAINTDAHRVAHLDLMPYGVTNARRGWVEAKQVVNTWSLERFNRWLANKA
ncbi:MAG: DNA polymerase/3'-5' exonuclease PolX, partial [Chloroflexi bacterium]|nr:DNA polymerase/3'-5' exonuclease PolX [Chloroflexota bacterium]